MMDWLFARTYRFVSVFVLGVALLIGVVSFAVEALYDSECAEMCEAIDSSMRVRTEYGCLCENGRSFRGADHDTYIFMQ